VGCLIRNYTIVICVCIFWLVDFPSEVDLELAIKLTCEKKNRPFCMPLYTIHRSVSCNYKLNKRAFFFIRICYCFFQFHQSHRATAEIGSVCISGCCCPQTDALPPSTVHLNVLQPSSIVVIQPFKLKDPTVSKRIYYALKWYSKACKKPKQTQF